MKLLTAFLLACFIGSVAFAADEQASNAMTQGAVNWESAPSSVAPSKKVLRWANDTQGGVPYAFYDPGNIKHLIGFEVEIVEAIARIIDRQNIFIQNDWSSLIPGLQRDSYDIAVGGLTYSAKADGVYFSKPYLISYHQLVIRSGDDRIGSLADCRGKSVGTLAGSESQDILEDLPDVYLRPYAVSISAFEDLSYGRIDAVLLDAPICLYYGAAKPDLKLIGDPIGRIEYCIAISNKDPALLNQVNYAIDTLARTGELRRIIERWGLWNLYMADWLHDYSPPMMAPDAYQAFFESQHRPLSWRERFNRYIDFMPLLGEASLITMQISILSMLLAITAGLIIALFRCYGPAPLRALGAVYVEVIRGTPLLIQLYIIYYGLPRIGIWLDPMTAGIVGLGLNYSAYEAENYRAGLNSVPVEQVEAASALALSRFQTLRYVVLPQAMRLVLPPVTNDFISLIKDSSLVSMITIIDLTQRYNLLATTYYDYFGIGLLVGGIYLLLGVPFVRLARWAELRLALRERGGRG